MPKRLLVLAAVAATSAGLSLAAQAAPLPDNTKTITAPVSSQVRAVVADVDSGNVAVKAGSTPGVVAVQHWLLVAPTTTVSESNGVLTVTSRCPSLTPPPVQIPVPQNNCYVDVTITVPPAVAVRATTGAGSISTTGMSGDEQLRTGAGNVVARGLSAAKVTASTGAGSISVVLTEAADALRMSTGAGNITAQVPAGAYAVTTSTGSGRVRLDGVTRSASSPHLISASTGSGSITLLGR